MRASLMSILLGFYFSAAAQVTIPVRLLEVTMNKTTNLVFPAAINSIDRGSERIIVQKSTGNVLRVKADTVFTDTTNLTVITVDGKLYSFLVSYSSSPAVLNIDLGAAMNTSQDTAMLSFAKKVKLSSNFLHGIRYGTGKVSLSIPGVYTNGELIGCKLKIENLSPLSFEIGRIRTMLGVTRSGKRRATQEQELPILLTDIEVALIRERQAVIAVILLPKSGLAPGQTLTIHIMEKGGERHLSLTVSNRYLLNAYLIL